MTNLINILIDAAWRGKGDLKKAGGDLRQLGNNATKTSAEMKKASFSFGGMQTKLIAASIAAGVLTVAFKKLYGLIESGAELQLVEQRFDRLALSIGTTGKALREDLGGAIRGLTSDAKAMALATDFMALGLVKSHDEAIRLASVAAQLGFDMNQLVLTLTNMTTMRFDALGVSVAGFKEKVKGLEDTGHDTNEAFKLAFLEQAEDQIEKVGSRIEETAGKLDVIGAAWANTFDDIKGGTTSALEPIIALFADVIIAAGDAETAVGKFGEALGDLETQEAAIEAVTAALQELNFLSIFTPGSVIKTREALIDLAVQLAITGETLEEQKAILESFGFTILDQEFRLHAMKVSWTEFQAALDIANFDRLAEQAAAADRAFFNLNDAFKETTKEFVKLTDETGKWTKEVQAAIDKGNEWTAALGDLNKMAIGGVGFLADAVGRSIMDAMKPRADIWLDFQADLTDISEREGERRAEVEGRYEERRTDIVDQYGERRARLEEQTAQRLDRIREDSADRQAQIRDAGNQRLSDLERDHLDRMQEIIENADLQLMDAAGRLDAAAVARIQRQREDALGDETDTFTKQRKDIKRQIDERIKAEQKAADKRIKREEENNAIRLQQMENAHQEQLAELKDKHDDELQEIKDNAIKARNEREFAYTEERNQLGLHWRKKGSLEAQWMNTILQQEEQWWKSRLALVGGGDADPIVPGQDPTDTGDDGTGEQKPGRLWLENTAVRVANPASTEAAFGWMNFFKTMSDAQLAAWIEKNSEIDVPGYEHGGRVPRDMLAMVGERGRELVELPGGSHVYDASLTRQFFNRAPNVTIGDIIVNEAERPGETGQEVREELENVFRELAGE